MKNIAISLCLLCSSTYLLAQPSIATKEAYLQAFTDLKNMLTGNDSIDYERAVFVTENAYYNNALDYSNFKHVLDYHTKMITLMAENARQENAEKYKTLTGYQKTMFMQNTANWAIFKYITDTTFFASNKMLYSTPYTYSATDPYGTAHWAHTQVINLLVNKTGNCYALAALFKLFSNRLQSDARLTVAPNHIYIENRNAKGDFKNVELATKTFPGDGSIQTLTYTTRELIMNGMAQRSLNDTAAVALNLIYLAKGYEKAFTNGTDEFIENCADVAYMYDTLSLNALLLKAELTENRLLAAMAENKLTTATQARTNLKTQKLLANYEKQLNNLYKLGYREVPANIAQLITAAKQGNTDGYITTNQTPNPFASMGKNQRYATLSWGLFDEIHAPQDTINYFSTAFNTKKKKVIGFAIIDTTNNYKVDPVVFACSIDPLAGVYPSISPYAFVANTPIIATDLDGKKITFGFLTSQDNIEEFKTILQNEFAGKVEVSVVDGMLTLHQNAKMQLTEREQKLYANLNIVIADPANVEIQLVKNDRSIETGSFGLTYDESRGGAYGSNTIDIGDVAKWNSSSSASGAVIAHEVWESYLTQAKGINDGTTKGTFALVHPSAEKVQADILGITIVEGLSLTKEGNGSAYINFVNKDGDKKHFETIYEKGNVKSFSEKSGHVDLKQKQQAYDE